MKKWLIVPAALLLVSVVFAACGSSDDETSGSTDTGGTATEAESGGSESSSDASVVYISPVAAQPGQQQISAGLEQGAGELGWSASVLDSALSPDKQVSAVETAINRGDSAIASWTLDPNAVAGAYGKAQNQDIPVIGMNSEGEGLTATVWWEHQLCEPGGPQAISAEKIDEIHPGAKTIMIGLELAESTKALSDCFRKEAERVGLDLINETNNEADTAAGSQTVFEPLLTKYPDVEAVWSYNDESALGVSAGLLAGGKQIAMVPGDEGVVVTGENGDQAAVEAVGENRMSWTWDPDNFASGLAAVRSMREALDTGDAEDVVVEGLLVDAESVGDYVAPEERGFTVDDLPLKE